MSAMVLSRAATGDLSAILLGVSDEHVDTYRRWYTALERGDYAAAEAEIDLDRLEIDDRDIVESTGADSLRVWLGRWNQAWESWRIEEQSIYSVSGDTVLALFRIFATGRGSGIELSRDDAAIAKFHDGKIVKLGYYNDQEQARRDAESARA